eukprot:483750-Amphidinium_carterae.1
MKASLRRIFPILEWLPKYPLSDGSSLALVSPSVVRISQLLQEHQNPNSANTKPPAEWEQTCTFHMLLLS